MKTIVKLNGYDIKDYGLTLLKGSLDNLLKPFEMKPLTLNDNATMDGSRALAVDRKAKSRDVVVNFLITSVDIWHLLREVDALIEELASSEDIELYVGFFGQDGQTIMRGITFHLLYLSCDKYSGFGENSATLSIKFKELNPRNRA